MQDIIKSEKSNNEMWLNALSTWERKRLMHSVRHQIKVEYFRVKHLNNNQNVISRSSWKSNLIQHFLPARVRMNRFKFRFDL